MKNRTEAPSRTDAWKNATWVALVMATAILVLVKLFTGIMFLIALLLAVVIFLICLGFIMRLTPRGD